MRPVFLTLVFAGAAFAAEDVVFRSDVSLVRVDVQVLDADHRAITGLTVKDFELKEENRVREIRNFATEDMPVDVLLLLDVSASMRTHVERIAGAAHEAFAVLGKEDRVGIMVFDRMSRVRMPFRNSRDDVERELESLLRQERFNGGTDITRAMYDAIRYVSRAARRDARRAIVILTDDRTEMERDDQGVLRELAKASTVLSALIAPDAMGNWSGSRRPMPTGGGGWPGGGGGWPGGGSRRGGVVIFPPPTFPGPGGRIPGGGAGRLHSAGTSEIAEGSGGDSMPVSDTSALETTLAHLRQRYALYFLEPADAKAGQQRVIDVQLAPAARRRYPNAELRFRTTYIAQGGSSTSTDPSAPPPEVTTVVPATPAVVKETTAAEPEPQPAQRRRVAVDESSGSSKGPLKPE